MLDTYKNDRDTLITWMGHEGAPSRVLKPLLRRLGYQVKRGKCQPGHDCHVDFGRRVVLLPSKSAEEPERARGAAAKALAHIRLHSHQKPEAYRDWWHWEALCYASIFCCPIAGCWDTDTVESLAKGFEVTPPVVRLALRLYGLTCPDLTLPKAIPTPTLAYTAPTREPVKVRKAFNLPATASESV